MLKYKLKKIILNSGRKIFKVFPSLMSICLPGTLVVEASNICMLKCRLCATVNNPLRAKGCMSAETFKKIIDQVDWKLKIINFSYAGEPLVNKDIFKMVKMANKKNIASVIETNGMLLEERIDELLDVGLYKLNIAFDGVSQKSVSRYRTNIDFNRVITGIKNLITKKNKLGLKQPEVHLQFIVMKHNESEMNDAKRIAKDIGVDFIDFKSLILSGGNWLNVAEKTEFATEFLPKNSKFIRYQFKNGSWVLKDELQGVCPYVFSAMVVMWNGVVTVCTMDVNGRFKIGDIEKSSLRKIWQGSDYALIRKRILKRELPECKECAYLVDHYVNMRITK